MDTAIGVIEVDNPYYSPSAPTEHRRIGATRSLRDDPLARLHHRGQIGDAEYRAGRKWQELYEAAEIGRIGSIDPSREPVDCGGRPAVGVTDRQQRAMRRLNGLYPVLGKEGSALVHAVLAERKWLDQIALEWGEQPTETVRKRLGWLFRRCLKTLAEALGYG